MDNKDFSQPIINGIDANTAIARLAGKSDRYYKMLRKFAKTLDDSVPPFDRFVTNSEEALGLLHTTKGVSGNLGMTMLFDAIRTFEETVRNGSPDRDLYNKMDDIAKNSAREILEKTEKFGS